MFHSSCYGPITVCVFTCLSLSSEVVCRQLSLTCRKQNAQRSEEMKRFSRGDRDFMTRVTPPLKL
ncbi:hypothetical protein F7725_001402, partial [Dissostichus mawsoni]